MNNEEILRIFVRSKNGDISAQKTIVNLIKEAIHPLVLSFLPNVKKLGMDYSDLEDLAVEAMYNVYEKADVDKTYDFINLAKFYYLKAVQNEIRYRTRDSRNVYSNTLSFDNPDQNVELMLAKESRYFEPDIKEAIGNDVIYTDSIIENNAKLTVKERTIVMLFLNDVAIKDIANKYKLTYQTVYKHIKNALKKIKEYIQIKYKGLYQYI